MDFSGEFLGNAHLLIADWKPKQKRKRTRPQSYRVLPSFFFDDIISNIVLKKRLVGFTEFGA